MNYSFVAFGAIEGEVLVDNVGMLLLMNYNKKLAPSKLNDVMFIEIIRCTQEEMLTVTKGDATTNEIAAIQYKRATLLLSSCICMFEILSPVLSGFEDEVNQKIADSLLHICKECSQDLTF